MTFLSICRSVIAATKTAMKSTQFIVRVKEHDQVTKLASDSLRFKGSFPPGKLSEKELKVMDKADAEFNQWNQMVLKAREEAAKKPS